MGLLIYKSRKVIIVEELYSILQAGPFLRVTNTVRG